MIEIFSFHPNGYFIDYFILMLKLNNIEYTIFKNKNDFKIFDLPENINLTFIDIIKNKNKIYAVDSADRITSIEHKLLPFLDIYYKCQLPKLVINDKMNQKTKRAYKFLISQGNKIRSLPMFGPIKFKIQNYNFKDYDLINLRTKLKKKKYKIVTYTRSRGKTDIGRIKLYNILINNFPDEFYLISDKIIPLDKPINKKWFSLTDNYDELEGNMGHNYSTYLDFISSGYFMLNLSGHSGSNPHRIRDALLTNTCVISSFIYADAYSDFPCYKIDANTAISEVNEKKMIEQIKYLLDNYEQIYNDLLVKQKEWFKTNFKCENYMKYFS